jgi:antitoxin component YwqK of YwqJK toxin-antitoxin module
MVKLMVMELNNLINRIKSINPNIKFVGEFDSYNQKTGYWEWYHHNGNLWQKGYFINGKKEGYWQYYHSDGKIMFKKNYKNGILHKLK